MKLFSRSYGKLKHLGSKKVYLHLGMHKTGTSSIQKTLFSNEKSLHKYNYHYLKETGANHSIPFFSLFSEKPQNYHINIRAKRSKDQVHEFNVKNQTLIDIELNEMSPYSIIISGEDMGKLSEKSLSRLLNYIRKRLPKHEIIVIIYVRESISYLSSAIQTRIRSGNDEKWMQNKKKIVNLYRDNLGKIIKIFGLENLRVYSFEAACKHDFGPVGFFLQSIGFSTKGISKIDYVRVNEGSSNKAIELMQYINERKPLFINNSLNVERANKDLNPLRKIRGGKFQIRKEMLEGIDLSQDKVWLFDQFGIDYTKDTNILREERIKYDEEYFDDLNKIKDHVTKEIRDLIYDFFVLKEKKVNSDSEREIMRRLIAEYDNTTIERGLIASKGDV
jgi:hypothetical protein